MNDLRFAFRQLAKTPAFTAIAVLTLALGIGCAATMYSGLQAFVLDPFSYPKSDQLVHVWSNDGQPFSTPDYLDMKEQATVFTDFGAYNSGRTNIGGDNAQSALSVSCTSGVLRVFGVAPEYGRLFEPSDEQPGAPPVVILSHRTWQESFAGDASLVGRDIRLNGGKVTVVGIMPKSFEFASPWMRTNTCQLWLPLQLKRGEGDRGSHWLLAVGRLKEGISLAAADSAIKAIGTRLKAAYPNTNSRKPFLVRSMHVEMTRFIRPHVWMLFSAVILLLLVACSNVASMLLARSARRHGEFGVRIALGAGRSQILRLALCESLLLSVAGSIAGLALSLGGVRILQLIAPVSEARKAAMGVDIRVVAFAACLTILTALLAGLPPGLAALRISVADLLRVDSRSAAGSRTRHGLLRILIIAQIALAFVLANGAALFSAGYVKLLDANSSLATDYVLSAEINLRGDRYAKKEDRTRFFDLLAARAAALPGVAAAGITTKLPLEGGSNLNILVNDETFDPTVRRTLSEASAITPGYFAAVGIPLLKGRTLENGDVGNDSIGVVVNRALAEKCWPNEDPLGKIIRPDNANARFHARVVGMVENVRQWGPDSLPKPEIFWTPDRAWGQRLFLIVRSPQPAAQLAPLLRRELAALDQDLPLARVRTLRTVVVEATQGQRVVAGLVDFFMAVALGLVGIGLFGTLSYHVLQNTREIGVRMALGALPGDILRFVFRQGFAWVLVGVILGLGAALALGSTLKGLVYGVGAVEPLSLLGAITAVATAAVLACWLPARRASKVDPMVALRAD